ncbi:MAG: NAD kinase [Chitinophagales bacterium]|nr:NAD kinase [Chitinophagales bacterium]
MKIALYSRTLKPEDHQFICQLLDTLQQNNINWCIYQPYWEQIQQQIQPLSHSAPETFVMGDTLEQHVDFVWSIGGDGTIINTIDLVHESGVPVLGINTGRLGLLTDITKSQIRQAVHALQHQQYTLDRRTLLQLHTEPPLFKSTQLALNEFAIHKKDTSAMITIHTYLDGAFLNSYWADGIIVATPSGSTAYSLSCGGPIVQPDTQALVITPVAPHNLNMRPIIIPDKHTISFEISGRNDNYLCSLDSRYATVEANRTLTVTKAPFTLNLVRLTPRNFYTTIRQKLLWGQDSRN